VSTIVLVCRLLKSSQSAILIFFYNVAGCNNATVCPRFNSSSNCTESSAYLICVGGNVIVLCVLGSEVRDVLTRHLSPCRDIHFLKLNGSIPSAIGQLTSLVYLCVFRVSAPELNCFARRGLYKNELTGPIPSAIGQLQALTYLCVVMLAIRCRSSPCRQGPSPK
jgi:hypothetical protein